MQEIKITVKVKDINPGLQKYEYLTNETLSDALKKEVSERVNYWRVELTNRMKVRDVVPQVAYEYEVEAEVIEVE